MVRATILSIVLALAVGPGVSQCCGQWLDATTAVPSDCRHDLGGSDTQAGGHVECQPIGLSVVTMRKEAERRVASADSLVAIPVGSFQFVAATPRIRVALGATLGVSESRRPLAPPLRI